MVKLLMCVLILIRLMGVIDLSQRIDSEIRVFPGSPQPAFIKWSNFNIHGFDSEVIFLSTHTGTHIDSPSHFIPEAPSIDKIDANRFVSNAILLNVPKGPDGLITKHELLNYEIKSNDAVVLLTGWEKNKLLDNYMSRNPGLSEEAARYLADIKVNAVAIDGPSIDAGQNNMFPVHHILLSNDILIIENLCNLKKIKNNRFILIVTPLKLFNASGSPVRAVAITEDILI